jgi:membrane-associated phospholipid phosphatase
MSRLLRRNQTLSLRARSGSLGVAAFCLVGLGITWTVAALIPASQAHDAVALDGFTHLPLTGGWPYHVAELASPATCLALGTLMSGVALLRGRQRDAIAVPIILLGSALTTQLIKPLLAHPNGAAPLGVHEIPAASWPSGHATAAMALALCGVLVVPKQLRLLAAGLGAAFAIAVGFSLLTLARHLPSDVIGGYLVAALWISLTLAAQQRASRRWPVPSAPQAAGRPRGHRRLSVGAVLVACALIAVLSALRGSEVLAYASDHPSVVVTAGMISALAIALATSLALAVSRS